VGIERSLLENFGGGCHTAFGAWARRDGSAWKVTLGLERPGDGWSTTAFTGSPEACRAQGPDTLGDFTRPRPESNESLCHPWKAN
jgi:hypothetical protein